ncbi:argininosuccinate lyase [Wenxinia marina]|uniref:Argininosuccinate lyase n=1 Tax=Wenxinia marina DSM 24838 TaxID=1123501 RepID=A0A0D0P875_9RHOB|nr:argininosuccinate lyase [Wenxinia marina]KIQ67776.1 argininosuccinate lyase [Wenxinia marina DSM 24838]GGL77332.1 argininosuccinate lyase 2 [Wenxinia marina]
MSVTDPRATDDTRFPDPVYRDTVLAPLFDGARTHHVDGFRRIDRAHLVMLAETGIVERETAAAIAGALEAIDREVDPSQLTYTGEVEDWFFLVEAELKKRVGPDTGGWLHTGRSRNDIDHTLFKMSLKAHLDRLMEQARAVLAALIGTARRESGTIIVAYTHGQPAQPTTLGHYLGAAIEVLIRDIERLEAARATCDLCSMGAAAITTTGFPIDRARVAQLLGFAAPQRNSYSCIAAVDYTTGAYSAVELLFLHLGRLIQDFQVWSSFEVGQLYVPNAFVQISSIMPQKRNPVPIEHMRHLASQTMGRARTMKDIMHNTPFTDMNDSEGESQSAGYEAFASGGRVLDLLAAFVAAMRIDPAKVDRNIRRSCITITELADTVVRREGLSFRQAHEIAAATARAVVAEESDLPSGYAAFAAAFEHATGRAPGMDESAFREAASSEHFIAVRDRFGGPAPEPMEEALHAYDAALDGFTQRAEAAAAREADSAAELDTTFRALTEAR